MILRGTMKHLLAKMTILRIYIFIIVLLYIHCFLEVSFLSCRLIGVHYTGTKPLIDLFKSFKFSKVFVYKKNMLI